LLRPILALEKSARVTNPRDQQVMGGELANAWDFKSFDVKVFNPFPIAPGEPV
jgi:hypothetical protein